jgi:WhiB family transcriptional regulator, redox-sensing transcriptional regulator
MSTMWMEKAKCKDRTDLTFFPENGDNAVAARRFCGDCAVRVQCLEYALRHNLTDGVWGGKTPNERKAIRRKARAV